MKPLSNPSADLEDNLTADGHFFVECVHHCGHSEPPFEGPAGFSKYKALWDFAFDHPYWLNPGESPYKATGIPDGTHRVVRRRVPASASIPRSAEVRVRDRCARRCRQVR